MFIMLPFACGARNFRHIRSKLKISAKLSKTAARALQVKHARTISVIGVPDRQCSNNRIQEILNKHGIKAFSTPAYNLSAACSSALLLIFDDGTSALTLAAGSGDDEEVTTSAGKKRKHWIKIGRKG